MQMILGSEINMTIKQESEQIHDIHHITDCFPPGSHSPNQ